MRRAPCVLVPRIDVIHLLDTIQHFKHTPSKINGPYFFPPQLRGCVTGTQRDWFCWIRNDSFCTPPWFSDLWNIIIYERERLNPLIQPRCTEQDVTSESSFCFITAVSHENVCFFRCWSKRSITKHKDGPNHTLQIFYMICPLRGHVWKYWLWWIKTIFHCTSTIQHVCHRAQCTLDRCCSIYAVSDLHLGPYRLSRQYFPSLFAFNQGSSLRQHYNGIMLW